MNDELKPCPFCGGEAQLMHEGEWHWVECSLPDCYTMPWKDLGISGAVEAWNTRPLEASLRAQLAEKDKEIKGLTEALAGLGYTPSTDDNEELPL